MHKIQNKKTCPISGLPITTNPEWEYKSEDGRYSLGFKLIGDDILFHNGVGVLTMDGMNKYITIVESIIDTYFKNGKYFYQITDLSLAKGFEFETRKPYVQWGEKIAKIMHVSLYYNVSFSMKTIIKIGKTFSTNFDMMDVVDSYDVAMNRILDHKSQLKIHEENNNDLKIKEPSLDKSKDIIKSFGKEETDRINELILYMGKMSWWNELDQKIPTLPKDDPFSGLFDVVASIQKDLRQLNKRRDLEKELLEKDIKIQEQRQALILEQVQSEKLKALRFQLKPHFLYNILNSLHYLIKQSPDKAREMTMHLAKYFQHILSEELPETVTLKNEINLIDEYIALQKLRYEDKLESNISCPEKFCDYQIPGLIIFPLIENAVKYGYGTHDGVCSVNFSVTVENKKLIIVVENSGKWVEIEDVKKKQGYSHYDGGIGLENIRKRLRHHYNKNWSLTHKEKDGKVIATLIIPKI